MKRKSKKINIYDPMYHHNPRADEAVKGLMSSFVEKAKIKPVEKPMTDEEMK